jgi:HEAT repeat protein
MTMDPKDPRPARRHRVLLAGGVVLVATALATTGTARAALERVSRFLSLDGPPVPSSANVLSDHEIERLDSMPAQHQAELLLERSINHYAGANEQIAARSAAWRGHISHTDRLDNLFRTAINSNDVRVRAAGIEVNIAARNVEKTAATVDRLENAARWGEQGPRANALWDLALIGNRGVEQQRVADILLASLDDPNENIRYWAVEGLAFLGTDDVVAPLLRVLRRDASPMIRERAACGLAQSGMLERRQRQTAIPTLLDYADDPALDGQTRSWVFQALRDITGQTLPRDAGAWRRWYDSARWRLE